VIVFSLIHPESTSFREDPGIKKKMSVLLKLNNNKSQQAASGTLWWDLLVDASGNGEMNQN